MNNLRILAIDTSGKVASVAICDSEKLLWEKSVYTKLTHSQVILPMVEQALSESGFELSDIDCAAVANGPGSYTGLRIGIGAVKGMCEGCKSLKCAGISTLLALAYNCVSFKGRIIADSRHITRISEDKVAKDSEVFAQLDVSAPVMLVGDNAGYIKQEYFADCRNVITANAANVLQRASSLCLAVQADESLITSADKLEVSYLQATKAEKDKAHSDKQEEVK